LRRANVYYRSKSSGENYISGTFLYMLGKQPEHCGGVLELFNYPHKEEVVMQG
jgi:hypothetical protein